MPRPHGTVAQALARRADTGRRITGMSEPHRNAAVQTPAPFTAHSPFGPVLAADLHASPFPLPLAPSAKTSVGSPYARKTSPARGPQRSDARVVLSDAGTRTDARLPRRPHRADTNCCIYHACERGARTHTPRRPTPGPSTDSPCSPPLLLPPVARRSALAPPPPDGT
ncbi:hypothetical protein DFH07DRAFT_859939 [Mycena maculata]|uniref:Uncharacterized protein n=1 Tax=Mycena maculata TaxID=230809 RepID=A0AAD7HF51_9AGAR|nr:hypothetical protein DFH07DRAFT_859939 [Mycena maculata]